MANIEPKLPPIMARINKVFSGIRCVCCIAHRLSHDKEGGYINQQTIN